MMQAWNVSWAIPWLIAALSSCCRPSPLCPAAAAAVLEPEPEALSHVPTNGSQLRRRCPRPAKYSDGDDDDKDDDDDKGAGVVASVRRRGAADWAWERSCDETKCRNSVGWRNDFRPGFGGYSCWTPTPLVSDDDAEGQGNADEAAAARGDLFTSSASASASAAAAATSTVNLFVHAHTSSSSSSASSYATTTTATTEHMPLETATESESTTESESATLPAETLPNITRPACADGLEAHVVLDSPTLEHDGVEYVWYTCCAPLLLFHTLNDDDSNQYRSATTAAEEADKHHGNHQQAAPASQGSMQHQRTAQPPPPPPPPPQPPPRRQCSDTSCRKGGHDCWADVIMEPMTCDRTTEFRHPRQTGAVVNPWGFWFSQYICCSVPGPDGSPVLKNAFPIELVRAALCPVSFASCLLVICGILSSKETRENAYNLYLVFLAAPDALYLGFNAVAGALALSGVHVKTYLIWGFQSFYMTDNLCINAVVSVQIYHLLMSSRHRRKTNPPTPRRACIHAAIVCLWAASIALSISILYGPLVHLTARGIRLVWLVTTLVATVPPFFCMAYVCVRVYMGGLLPRSGQTRVLSMYYLRVILAFILFWVPSSAISTVSSAGLWTTSKKMENLMIVLILMILQGMVSSALALKKPDVAAATRSMLQCRCVKNNTSSVATHDETGTMGPETIRDATVAVNISNGTVHNEMAQEKDGGVLDCADE